MQDRVLPEFEDELRARRLPFLGGEGFAKGLLSNALGEERAREMWSRLEAPRRPAFEALERPTPTRWRGSCVVSIRRPWPSFCPN